MSAVSQPAPTTKPDFHCESPDAAKVLYEVPSTVAYPSMRAPDEICAPDKPAKSRQQVAVGDEVAEAEPGVPTVADLVPDVVARVHRACVVACDGAARLRHRRTLRRQALQVEIGERADDEAIHLVVGAGFNRAERAELAEVGTLAAVSVGSRL